MDRLRRLLLLTAVLALAAAACTGDAGGATTTTVPGSSSTTEDPGTTTTTLPDTTPPSVPWTASDSLSDATVERIVEQITELIAQTEEVRGLPFLEVPAVAILDETEFAQRVSELIAEELDPEETAVDAQLLALLGLLPEGFDWYTFQIDLYTEQVAGFYDGDTEELVVPASEDGFTPLQKVTVIHELIHALTDQHFDFNDEYEIRADTGSGDDAAALLTLVEGDATYFQFIYLQELSPMEQVQAATEALTIDTAVLNSAPDWVEADLTFPYEQGLAFTTNLVSGGGIAAVDTAYQQPPATTEQVLDPVKYGRGEQPIELPPLTVDLAGWTRHDEGSNGEWGLRLLLWETLDPGVNTQAGAGWGNDRYVALSDGDDVAYVMHYIGDTVRDAEELADALIAHARGPMAAGSPQESGGGLLFGSGYVFIDRVEDEVFFIASTDPGAGAELRTQLGL